MENDLTETTHVNASEEPIETTIPKSKPVLYKDYILMATIFLVIVLDQLSKYNLENWESIINNYK